MRSLSRAAVASVAAIVAASVVLVLMPAPASAAPPPITTQGWVYEFDSTQANLFSSVTPLHPDFGGSGVDAVGWASGALPFPLFRSVSGTTGTWGSSTVTMVGEVATVVTSVGSIPVTVVIDGASLTWTLNVPSQSLISGLFPYVLPPSRAATEFGTDSTVERWWFDGHGDQISGAFAIDNGVGVAAFDDGSGLYLLPDGPIGPSAAAAIWTISMSLLGTPPCSAPRSSILEPLSAALPAVPSAAEAIAVLQCADSLGTGSTTSGASFAPVALALPSDIVSAGFTAAPSLITAAFDGLPPGVTAVLDAAAVVGEPFTGTLTLTVSAVLPATGRSVEQVGAIAASAALVLLLGSALVVVGRRHRRAHATLR
jgi:hypothetical protein